MQNNINRASQFQPFDSLKGFKEALSKMEENKEEKKYLNDDLYQKLNNRLQELKIGDDITIEYYNNLEYIKTIGKLKKIDYHNKIIYVANSKISLNDIIDIN